MPACKQLNGQLHESQTPVGRRADLLRVIKQFKAVEAVDSALPTAPCPAQLAGKPYSFLTQFLDFLLKALYYPLL